MVKKKRSFLQMLGGGLTKVNKAASYIAVVPMFLIMLLAVMDVVGGKLFNQSIQSSTEMIQYMNVPLVCLAMGFVEHQSGHTRIQVLTRHYPRVLQKALYVLGSLIGCVVSLFVAYMAVSLMAINIERMTPIQATSSIPVWPFVLCLIVGYVLTALAFIYSGVRELLKKDESTAEHETAEESEV